MTRFIVALLISSSLWANSEGPAPITLTEKQQKLLDSGKPVFAKPVEIDGKGGGALAVFRVNAPPKAVWKVIEDFDQYPKWVDGVESTARYEGKNKDRTYIQFKVGKMFTPTYTYHVEHNYANKDQGFGTWALDSDKENDLTHCTGHWRVTPVADHPDQSTVEYTINLQANGMILKILRPMLLKNGVKNATYWVKKQSEEAVKTEPK